MSVITALTAQNTPQAYLHTQARWTPIEIAFWAATLLPYWLFPDYLSLASQNTISAGCQRACACR